MHRLALQFVGPHQVDVIEERLPSLAVNQVMVKTIVSAISSGTEMLIYRGDWPDDMPVDATITALSGSFAYPLKYGYSAIGRVIEAGADVLSDWLGKVVFAFNPHESHFVCSSEHLLPLPTTLSPELWAFLPNMETAVNLLMDGRPMMREAVVVFGQGVVGLLTTALLARFPLGCLATVDRFPLRREASRKIGSTKSLDPTDLAFLENLSEVCAACDSPGGADLCYELSGNPSALNQAISVTGYSGRIVIGSWYGRKQTNIDLGGRFHRSRIHVVSSQVSTVAPGLTGRWTKTRRLKQALTLLEDLHPVELISHRFPLTRAREAYALLHEHPDQAIQVMLTYEDMP